MRRHFKSRNYIWNSQKSVSFKFDYTAKRESGKRHRKNILWKEKRHVLWPYVPEFVYLKICPRLLSSVALSTKKGFEAFTLMKSDAFNAKLLKGTTWNMTTSLGLCYCISNSEIVNSYKLEKCDVPHLWSSGLCSSGLRGVYFFLCVIFETSRWPQPLLW